jgi:hypothetical protein
MVVGELAFRRSGGERYALGGFLAGRLSAGRMPWRVIQCRERLKDLVE